MKPNRTPCWRLKHIDLRDKLMIWCKRRCRLGSCHEVSHYSSLALQLEPQHIAFRIGTHTHMHINPPATSSPSFSGSLWPALLRLPCVGALTILLERLVSMVSASYPGSVSVSVCAGSRANTGPNPPTGADEGTSWGSLSAAMVLWPKQGLLGRSLA